MKMQEIDINFIQKGIKYEIEIEYVYNKLKQLRFDFKESDRKLFPNEYTFEYGLGRYVRVDGNDLYISKDTFKPLEEELEYADKIGCPLKVF